MPTPEPLYIYDPAEAEVLKPLDLLKNLDQLGDEDLADLITLTEALQKDLAFVVNQLRATLTHRMEADQATLRQTAGYEIKLTPQRDWQYNLPRLMHLKALLPPDLFAKAMPTPEPQPNKTELNKLVKLGGDIKQIIEAACIPVPKRPKLEITRKNVEVPANA